MWSTQPVLNSTFCALPTLSTTIWMDSLSIAENLKGNCKNLKRNIIRAMSNLKLKALDLESKTIAICSLLLLLHDLFFSWYAIVNS